MKSVRLICQSLFFCGLVVACASPLLAQCDGDPDLALAVLFDTSGSIPPAVSEQYQRDFSTILDMIAGGANAQSFYRGHVELRVSVVTGNSLSNSGDGLRICLPAFNSWTSNVNTHKNKMTVAIRQAKADVAALLKNPSRSQTTDLFGAMAVIQKSLRGGVSSKAKNRFLVIFSDMLVEEGGLNFEKDVLTPSRIDQIIQKEKSMKALPDLRGVRVWVSGAGSHHSKLSRTALLNVQEFWVRYFAATGAMLNPDHYSGALQNFSLPTVQ